MKSYLLIASGLGLAATLTLSHGLLRAAAAFPPMEYPWTIRVGGALFLYALVFVVYTRLLQFFDISALYPIYTALSVIGVIVMGVVFFGEQASITKVIGGAFLLFGIALIAR